MGFINNPFDGIGWFCITIQLMLLTLQILTSSNMFFLFNLAFMVIGIISFTLSNRQVNRDEVSKYGN